MTAASLPMGAPEADADPAPPSLRHFERLGFGVVALVFGGLFFWSVIAPIDGAVLATARVVVESNRQVIQHLEGGVVTEILVDEGDLVDAGDALVRLDETTPRASASLIDAQLAELYARRARLEAERDGADDLASSRGAPGVLRTEAFSDKRVGQEQLFRARRETRLTQISLLEERIVQQQERMGGLKAQIASLTAQNRLIADELTGVRELHAQGYAPLTRVRALEREIERLSGERGALEAGVAEAESVVAEARLEIERLRESGREEAITELRDVEVSIAELEERRIAAQDSLKRTEIFAPLTGRVIGLSVHTIGGVVAPGAPLMEIVPEGDTLLIAARVAPHEVDRVAPGQETLIRFSAFGGRATPEAFGVVRTVSADSIVDEATGTPYYLVMVDLPVGEELSLALKGRQLLPGMPVEAFIRTGSRPAISYLIKPLTDSFARSLREE